MLTPTERKLYTLPRMQKLFWEKMGECICTDKIYDPEMEVVRTVTEVFNPTWIKLDSCVHWAAENAIRLPLPIDPINPERGLWGMIDWNRFDYVKSGDEGFHIYMQLESAPWWVDMFIGDVTEALLRALMQQEGIEE